VSGPVQLYLRFAGGDRRCCLTKPFKYLISDAGESWRGGLQVSVPPRGGGGELCKGVAEGGGVQGSVVGGGGGDGTMH
jgi:hypothetical protein